MQLRDPHSAAESYVTLHVPCEYGHLRVIRQAVMDLCARAGLSEFEAAQMEMAVDEACANIIEHSYGGESAEGSPKNPGLRLNLVQTSDRLILEIFDQGRGFDFEAHRDVDPQQFYQSDRERGLGMYIIRRFVDEVSYARSTGEGNRLTLVKRL